MEISRKNFVQDIQEVSDLFYQNQIEEGKRRMPVLIQKLSQMLATLPSDAQMELLPMLKSAMEAMEAGEYIMLADILTFDILDRL